MAIDNLVKTRPLVSPASASLCGLFGFELQITELVYGKEVPSGVK